MQSLIRHSFLLCLTIFLLFLFYEVTHLLPFWMVITTLFFTVTGVVQKTFTQFLLTAAIAIAAISLSVLLGFNTYLMILYLATISAFGVWFNVKYTRDTTTIFVIILLCILLSAHSYVGIESLRVVKDIAMSLCLLLFIKVILIPINFYQTNHSLQQNVIKALMHLNKELFSCLLEADYKNNVYFYERRVHFRKLAYLRALRRLSDYANAQKKVTLEIGTFKIIYYNLIDLGQLRRRVTDYTTFSLCKTEIENIGKEIDRLLTLMLSRFTNKKSEINLKIFSRYIQALNDSYHHVLQIAAKEPLVFALFINSLNMLKKRFDYFFNEN